MSSSILLNSIALKPLANSANANTWPPPPTPPVGVSAAALEADDGGGGVGKDDDDDDVYATIEEEDDADDDEGAVDDENENAEEDDDDSTGLRYITRPSTRSTSITACNRSFGASQMIALRSVSDIGSDTDSRDRTRCTTADAAGREPFPDTLVEELPATVLLCFSPVEGCPLSKTLLLLILLLLLLLTKLFLLSMELFE